MIFLSTPSARRATSYRMGSPFSLRDFYPRPPRGGRRPQVRRNLHRIKFLSTPSARRATDSRSDHDSIVRNFYPRPPRGGRPMPTMYCGWKRCYFYPRPPRGGRLYIFQLYNQYNLFLSTPSARRATYPLLCNIPLSMISIHALREEGDPYGGQKDKSWGTFLSTPSARRATAKTETKSLFSNKLYNILHEFRRALIYNGSKNYPNHAK